MNQSNKQETPVVLVTGAARRIGAAIVLFLHQKGFNIALHYHESKGEAEQLLNTLNASRPNSARGFCNDLRDIDAACLINEVLEWRERLDVLVNNASLFLRSDDVLKDIKQWDELFAVNVRAPFWLSHAAYPALAQRKGSIINITDIHGEKPLKGYGEYCQTKAALLMQTKILAKEFAPVVRVNAISPGAIAWPEKENRLDEKQKEKIIQKTPLQCHGDPLFIAKAVFSMIDNPFITGQVLCVDGGRSLG